MSLTAIVARALTEQCGELVSSARGRIVCSGHAIGFALFLCRHVYARSVAGFGAAVKVVTDAERRLQIHHAAERPLRIRSGA